MSVSSGPRKGLIAALFFGSGAAGLLYELVWSKYLGNLLGSAAEANAAVVATFMLGLALGAALFGSVADRTKHPLRLYALLEVGVGLYALAFPTLFRGISALYVELAPHVPEGARLGPKLLCALVLLLVPTVLMGGTLPALARVLVASQDGIRKELARLYAVNSLGAAFGVFVAGVRLVPALGLWKSASLAAGLNLFLGAAAFALSRTGPQSSPPQQAPAVEEASALQYPRPAVRAALFGAGVSGFTSFLCEVTWIRLLAVVLGGSTYSFTLALTVFILGIGLGSSWLSLRRQDGDLLRLFGKLQVALAISIALALPLYVRLPYVFAIAQVSLEHTLETWPIYQALTFSICCLVLLVPTFLMGAGFPAAARVVTRGPGDVGRGLGRLYLANTAGSVLGASVGGLWLMPRIGMEGNFLLSLGLSLAAAAVAFRWAPTGGRRRSGVWLAVGVAAVVVYGATGSGWARFLSNGSTFRDHQLRAGGFAGFRQHVESEVNTLFYRDDPVASVSVSDLSSTHGRILRINGKTDASSNADMNTQALVGHYGLLLHPRPVKRVLIVGLGSGVTVGAVLSHDIERVDVVEISAAVVEGAKLFSRWNRDALSDPRCHVHVDDAKTFMRTTLEPYDLVISEPSNPWVAGEAGLFTQEFYQDVAHALTPDGLLVAWTHTYESDEGLVQLVVRTLRTVFPHSTTWLGGPDLIFVASREPFQIDPERIRSRMTPRVREDLVAQRADDLLVLLAEQAHSEQGQAAFAGTGPLNTDDQNLLEYAAPIAFYLRLPEARIQDERRAPDNGVHLALAPYLKAHPMTADDAHRLYQHFSAFKEAHHPLLRSAAEAWHRLAPEDPAAAYGVARSAFAIHDLQSALAALEPAVARGTRDPELVALYLHARAAKAWAERSTWAPEDLCGLLPLADVVRPVALSHPQIAADLAEYDHAADPTRRCPGSPRPLSAAQVP